MPGPENHRSKLTVYHIWPLYLCSGGNRNFITPYAKACGRSTAPVHLPSPKKASCAASYVLALHDRTLASNASATCATDAATSRILGSLALKVVWV
eukprot:CAMPEP_0181349696 /NCGR_PEP_ID=MMETSP1106-20121128/864_1 /TAXON_ID=81844 /ORGANISM="Mantoniella antarctica, Strain SL-175" /LENGTH=95 /DNA_ID=CAMNT_0023462107 /DNA_START=410 /DNA_END=697 /DNA_ORIENTATION=-